MDAMKAAPGAARGSVGEVDFDRQARGLGGIVVKGTLLSLITFGIYRFWYITNLRRFFWSRTVVAGSPAEYLGRGKELFLGFLVALAILIPIYVGLFVVGFWEPSLAPFAGPISFVFLFLLGQYAIYRGRRYRCSRTRWRGIRLAQDGSALTYVAMATGWWFLTILTLGLAFPFMRASLERYRMNHTLIGDSRLSSTATGRSVLLPWLLFYLLGVVPILGIAVSFFATHGLDIPGNLFVSKEGGDIDDWTLNPAYSTPAFETMLKVFGMILAAALPAALLLIPYYRARETRAFMNAASLGEARLISSLRARQFYWPYILYFLAVIGFTIAIAVVFGIVFAVLAGFAGLDSTDTGGFSPLHALIAVGAFVLYLGSILLFAVLYIRIVTVRLWHAVTATTQIADVEALEAVLASTRRPGSALNEGLADALDVGGAIEIGF